jgi:DNA-binding MarR family transcriptional regulator
MYLIVRHFGNEVTHRFSEAGYDYQTEQFMILIMVNMNERINQKDIVSGALKSKATITRSIDKLVGQGLLKREEDLRDRRNNIITITANGRTVFKNLIKIYHGMEKAALKDIDPNDMETALRVIQRITDNISD